MDIAIVLSILALGVSIFTAWWTFFYRGKVKMASPSMIVLAYDAKGSKLGFDPKILVRTLIFSNGERGRVIESLFVRLSGISTDELFTVWGIDAGSKLERGGGLWVGKIGITAWHHFLAKSEFKFSQGEYVLQVFARIYGSPEPVELWAGKLDLSPEIKLNRHDGVEQIWFDLNPHTGFFQPRLETRQVIADMTFN